MKYLSTRNSETRISSAEAIAQGLAPDGGLFMPEEIPTLAPGELEALRERSYTTRAAAIMKKFLPDFSDAELESYVNLSYADNFDDPRIAPLRVLEEGTAFLELWHGPTCAFKDMALQILPRLLTASLQKTGEEREVCVLVATSGDTGKAALEGFKDVPRTKILVFYPQDGVSEVQKLQMTTQEGQNVGVCAVYGNFDDAQTGVKAVFGDSAFAEMLSGRGWLLSSANSINWGRLLPQIVYYISMYCDYVNRGNIRAGEEINVCVPTGNFGNILAGWYAREMGLPIRKLLCASNRNNSLTDFIETGVYDRNRTFYTTISPSMDILISSNLERLLYALSRDAGFVRSCMASLEASGVYEIGGGLRARINEAFAAGFCDDEETMREIAKVYREHDYLIDTHTAVASKVLREYRTRTGDRTPAVVVSTASPYKFTESVLRALGEPADGRGPELIKKLEEKTNVPSPEPLRFLDRRAVRFTDCVEKTALAGVVDAFLR